MVTLTPSASELVAAVGAAQTIVGVDDYSTYPPEITTLPKVGSFLSPNLSAILQLKPDLVIADDIHEDVVATLRDAGIEAVIIPMHDLSDVRRGLDRIATRLGHADAGKAVLDRIDQAIAAARARHQPGGPKVLAVIDRSEGGLDHVVAAGAGSWLDELLAIEGAQNVLAGSGVRYPSVGKEDILRAHPDLILDASFVATPDNVAHDWAGVSDHVVVVKAPYVQAPSPRVDEALRDLERALYATTAP